MGTQADVGVVGAGIVGLATADALLERGADVTVYERGVPGSGQSGGESRIFRHAHDDPRMVEMARRSRAIWREWEERFGTELVSADGVVALGPPVESRLPILDAAGGIVAHRIEANDIPRWLPLLSAVDAAAMVDEDGGAIRTTAAIQDSSGAFGETGVYAAPTPGNRSYAVGLSDTVEVREDGSVVDPAALAALDDRARAYVRRALSGLDPDPIDVRHCWVTALSWSDDGVAVWQESGVTLVAGHNLFKQAPALGRALAGAALGDGVPDELAPTARLGAAE